MNKDDLEKLVAIRTNLLSTFNKLRDYKSNTNAIMKEYDHAKLLHDTIISLDEVLKEHVNFSDKN